MTRCVSERSCTCSLIIHNYHLSNSICSLNQTLLVSSFFFLNHPMMISGPFLLYCISKKWMNELVFFFYHPMILKLLLHIPKSEGFLSDKSPIREIDSICLPKTL
ncbi:hypothetical protein ISN45_Aa07g024910 [Arabidopsis thaliana x Arabidopsis arenosa]|uniref:Uncharacterized protein n=1 Tax=Arabidopsis thaliana x Arabidopsis arenosa TaxID=1240361 RepID=A0A8T1Y8G8_9BRAS|nr:hypothetical protein ISN45_Aa07g024910 [Arabidopsis thaliana x Arabidopsis arenosa]